MSLNKHNILGASDFKIKETEVPRGTNMAQWALAWCLKNEAVTAVIPGCKSVQQVEQNARAADLIGRI